MFSHLKTLTSCSCHCYRNVFISNLVITKQTNNFPLYSQLYNLRSPVKASINTLLESPSLTGEKNKTKLQNTSMTMITCIHMLSSSSVGTDKFLHSQIVHFASESKQTFSTYIFSTLSTVSVPQLLASASTQRDTCYIHHSSHHRVNSPLGQPGLHSNQVMAVISNRLPCKSARIISSDNHQQSDFLRFAQKVTKNV